jgi:NAD(P)-dependent dehydrogenase (short-subunit alcohol dehydrogenase family)
VVTADRTIVVTGSSRGIGWEFVRQYLEVGVHVVATCRDPENAGELRALRGDLDIARLDVTSGPDLDALAAWLNDAPIDVLVCNAATFGGTNARFANLDFDLWRTAFETNVLGTIRVAMRLWPNVVQSRERKIVFLSSRAGLPRSSKANMSYVYASTKAALNAAARCLALDLAERGVIVALLNPGHVKSGIGGIHAPMTAEESVRAMRQVIAGLGLEHAGRFWHFDGTEIQL